MAVGRWCCAVLSLFRNVVVTRVGQVYTPTIDVKNECEGCKRKKEPILEALGRGMKINSLL